MVVGLGCGIIRMALEWSIAPPACGSGQDNEQFNVVQNVHYLHFAIILALVVAFVSFTISMLTPPRPKEKVRAASADYILLLHLCLRMRRIMCDQ